MNYVSKLFRILRAKGVNLQRKPFLLERLLSHSDRLQDVPKIPIIRDKFAGQLCFGVLCLVRYDIPSSSHTAHLSVHERCMRKGWLLLEKNKQTPSQFLLLHHTPSACDAPNFTCFLQEIIQK